MSHLIYWVHLFYWTCQIRFFCLIYQTARCISCVILSVWSVCAVDTGFHAMDSCSRHCCLFFGNAFWLNFSRVNKTRVLLNCLVQVVLSRMFLYMKKFISFSYFMNIFGFVSAIRISDEFFIFRMSSFSIIYPLVRNLMIGIISKNNFSFCCSRMLLLFEGNVLFKIHDFLGRKNELSDKSI